MENSFIRRALHIKFTVNFKYFFPRATLARPVSAHGTATPAVNIPLDAAILPVRLLSAQKQNLVISQTPEETVGEYMRVETQMSC
jgi:hypothetical protein